LRPCPLQGRVARLQNRQADVTLPHEFLLADSDVVHEPSFQAVIPSTDLLANDPSDFRLDTRSRPNFSSRDIWLWQRCSNLPN
jgi:hypothetical protein